MMKSNLGYLFLVIILIVQVQSIAQEAPSSRTIQVANHFQSDAPAVPGRLSYIMDFESVPDFSLTFGDWTVNDVDLEETYGIAGYSFPHQMQPMAFLCFNPAQVTPSMASDQAIQPHSGQRFGACFSSNSASNDDWFISPRIQLDTNGSFSFWVKSYTDLYGLDTYTVAVSTSDSAPGSFTTISGAQPLQTTLNWVKKTFSLSAYNNQLVYVAIHCVSNDKFLMMIDDLEVKPDATTSLTADFAADNTSVKLGGKVNFTDLSTGVPTTWNWRFTGGTPATSSLQNPTNVTYSTAGTFPVSLKVSNGSSSDSITKTAFITVSDYPTTLSLDFETVSDFTLNFSPWTAIDVKGGNTYGIQNVIFPHNFEPMAYICFNPSQTTPPLANMQAHSGSKLGCSFSSTPPMNPNDKWLISPKISLGQNAKVEFWVKTYNELYGYEKYNVAVSVTDLNPSSFVPVNTVPEIAPNIWTKRTYYLSNYTNQDVYVGIQCVTDTSFIFMIDDIYISSSLGIRETNLLDKLVAFPNPANDYLILNCPMSCPSAFKIDMISLLGEKIKTWNEVPDAGKINLDIRKIPSGVYLLRVTLGAEEVIRKVSIIH